MAGPVRTSAVVAASVLGLCGLGGCGGGSDDGPATLDVSVEPTVGGLVAVDGVTCRREGTQLLASGTVENQGDDPHYVSLSVRFVDADGVRVELTSDSVSDLDRSETARWDVTVYSDAAGTVVACEVDAEAS